MNTAFSIQGEDDNGGGNLVPYGPHQRLTAPTRPPSRAGSPSINLYSLGASGPQAFAEAPSTAQEEDAELNRAIFESQQSQQFTHGINPFPSLDQESGVTGIGQFGPATRTDYDPAQWAMVPTLNRAEDARPADRRRPRLRGGGIGQEPGAPVFLRCRDPTASHYLGNLLTIWHTIPAARNAFLKLDSKSPRNYGSNPEWWKGVPMSDSGGPFWEDELHRLMAFLEYTERSYGSVDTLVQAKLRGLDADEDITPEQDFFNKLAALCKAQETPELSKVFRTTIVSKSLQNNEPTTAHQAATRDYYMLNAGVVNDRPEVQTFYQLWDTELFPNVWQGDTNIDDEKVHMLQDPADVMTFRYLLPHGLPAAATIPEQVYLDRYMEENREEIVKTIRGMAKIRSCLNKLKSKEEKLTTATVAGESCNRQELLKEALRRCTDRIRFIKNQAAWKDYEEHSQGRDDSWYIELDKDPPLGDDEAKAVKLYEMKVESINRNIKKLEASLTSK